MAEPWEYIHTKKVLNKYGLPAGAFDPEAPGEQTYDIYWMNIRTKRGNSGSRSHEPEATLRISARNEGEDRHLGITCSDLKFDNTTEINAQCENNALTSPKTWTLKFSNGSMAGKGLVGYTQKGEIRNSRLLMDNKEPTRSKTLGHYTADWCLFDAVQRLAAGKDTEKHTFDLIEEFSMIRERQFLIYRGTSEITTDQSAVTADVYCHYGESVIPTCYYVDANGRLFLVVSTRRTVILKREAS